MPDVNERLVRCFTAVFPDLAPSEAEHASVETVAEWDSLAALTLVAVVEEEFGIQIDDHDLAELGSFTALRTYIDDRRP